MAFESDATNLVPGDTNAVTDIFTYDRTTGVTTRESIGPAGVQANAASSAPTISFDCRFVAFQSDASNLAPGVSGTQIYVRDRQLGVTIVASVSTGGIPSNGTTGFTRQPAISAEGRFVSFSSDATNLVSGDTNACGDIFTRDLVLVTTTRDSVSSTGTQANCEGLPAGHPSLSSDGRYVAFDSSATNLAAGTTAGQNVFVRDRVLGITTFEPSGESNPQWLGTEPSISADGRYLALHLVNNVEGTRIYLRDRLAGRTDLIASGRITSGSFGPPRLSADGRFIAYERVSRVPPFGRFVWVFDSTNGYITKVDAEALEPSAVAGDTVALASSASALIANDTNGVSDIFITSLSRFDVPGTPTDLIATPIGSAVTLTWNAPATRGAVSNYFVEAGSSPGAANLASLDTGSTATSFSASGVAAGTYFVRVRASNDAGTSEPSNEVILTVTGGCAPPAAPSNLTAAVSSSNVTLNWAAGAAATTYLLEVGSSPTRTDILVTDLGSAATTLSAAGVSPGNYFVRVRAKNACGTSGVSNEAMVIVR